MKKLLILLLLILVPTVVAFDDALTLPTYQKGGELDIVVPKNEFILPNVSFSFHVEVFNESGYLMNNLTAMCVLEIYTLAGNRSLISIMDFQWPFDFVVELDADVVGDVGLLPYTILCGNNVTDKQQQYTILGGYYSGTIKVNKKTEVNYKSIVGIALAILGCIAFFIVLFFSLKGQEWFHQSMRILFLLLSIWLVVLLANLGVVYVNENALAEPIASMVSVVYYVVVYAAWIFTFVFVLYFIYQVFNAFRIEKTKHNDEMLGK